MVKGLERIDRQVDHKDVGVGVLSGLTTLYDTGTFLKLAISGMDRRGRHEPV